MDKNTGNILAMDEWLNDAANDLVSASRRAAALGDTALVRMIETSALGVEEIRAYVKSRTEKK